MKNRDVEKGEINKITELCPIREKAFFTIMRQSGLTPHKIKQLKMKDVEKILEPSTPTPCKIEKGKFRSIPDFIGGEAVKYLKQYLATRTNSNLTPESLLFTIKNNPNKEINTKDVSRTFKLAARKLEKERKITYEIRKKEPSELRLYSLIRFYRKSAKYYLKELDNSSTPKHDEFYRKLYEEKAMPFLEIEPPTKTEMQQLEKKNKELEKELNMISESITNRVLPIVNLFDSIEGLEEFLKQFKTKQTKTIVIDEEKLTEELKKAGRKRDKMIDKKFKFYTSDLREPTPEEQIKFEQRLKEKELKERELKEQKDIHDVPRNPDDT